MKLSSVVPLHLWFALSVVSLNLALMGPPPVAHVKAPCIVCGRVCGPRPQMRTLIRQQAERSSFLSPTSVIRKPTPDTILHSDYPSIVFAMSSRRQNLTLSVEHPSPSCNRIARVVQMPEFVNTEENPLCGRTVSAISSYLVYTKLTLFRGPRAGAVQSVRRLRAERYTLSKVHI